MPLPAGPWREKGQKDAAGHEHKGSGPGGGQFTGHGDSRHNPDLDEAMGFGPAKSIVAPKSVRGERKPVSSTHPISRRATIWAKSQVAKHAGAVASHLKTNDAVAAKLLHRAIYRAMAAAVKSGSGSVVIPAPDGSGRRIRVTVRRKAVQKSLADGGEPFEIMIELIDDDTAHKGLIPRGPWLREKGGDDKPGQDAPSDRDFTDHPLTVIGEAVLEALGVPREKGLKDSAGHEHKESGPGGGQFTGSGGGTATKSDRPPATGKADKKALRSPAVLAAARKLAAGSAALAVRVHTAMLEHHLTPAALIGDQSAWETWFCTQHADAVAAHAGVDYVTAANILTNLAAYAVKKVQAHLKGRDLRSAWVVREHVRGRAAEKGLDWMTTLPTPPWLRLKSITWVEGQHPRNHGRFVEKHGTHIKKNEVDDAKAAYKRGDSGPMKALRERVHPDDLHVLNEHLKHEEHSGDARAFHPKAQHAGHLRQMGAASGSQLKEHIGKYLDRIADHGPQSSADEHEVMQGVYRLVGPARLPELKNILRGIGVPHKEFVGKDKKALQTMVVEKVKKAIEHAEAKYHERRHSETVEGDEFSARPPVGAKGLPAGPWVRPRLQMA